MAFIYDSELRYLHNLKNINSVRIFEKEDKIEIKISLNEIDIWVQIDDNDNSENTQNVQNEKIIKIILDYLKEINVENSEFKYINYNDFIDNLKHNLKRNLNEQKI